MESSIKLMKIKNTLNEDLTIERQNSLQIIGDKQKLQQEFHLYK